MIEELDLPLSWARYAHSLARSLRAFDDLAGARTEQERARAIFMPAGAVTPSQRIERELAELTEGPVDAGPSVH